MFNSKALQLQTTRQKSVKLEALFTGLGDWLGLAALEALPLPVPDPLGLPRFLPVPPWPLAWAGAWLGGVPGSIATPGSGPGGDSEKSDSIWPNLSDSL